MSYLGICVLLYSSLWVSYLYFNAEMTDSSGESIKFRDGKLAYQCQIEFSKSKLFINLKV
jgi:hypothetical protein